MGRLELEVGAAIDDAPAGSLDLGPEAIGRRPVAGCPRRRTRVRGVEDRLGDVGPAHPWFMPR
jgi:hypothetical protein